jgi:large subunit ribosomal protein L31
MKAGLHPELHDTLVKCTCGEKFTIKTTVPEIHIEICSKCHPFYTGSRRSLDRGGMVERFNKKYGIKKQASD